MSAFATRSASVASTGSKRRRARSVVLPTMQRRFAFEVLAVQVIAILAYQAAVQMRVFAAMERAGSFDVDQLLRDLFLDTLLTLVMVGPVLALLAFLMALRLSHRFFGPVPRLREALGALAEGSTGVRLEFRPGDALEGVDDDVNRLAERIEASSRARRDVG